MVDTFAEQRMRDVTTMAMEMDEDAEEDLRDLDRMFLKIDANNDGNLTFDELLEGAMKVREFQNRLRVMDIDQNDLQQLFLMLDRDGGGTIDPDEFKKTLSRWAPWMPRNCADVFLLGLFGVNLTRTIMDPFPLEGKLFNLIKP